jgi:hypothetical protein
MGWRMPIPILSEKSGIELRWPLRFGSATGCLSRLVVHPESRFAAPFTAASRARQCILSSYLPH